MARGDGRKQQVAERKRVEQRKQQQAQRSPRTPAAPAEPPRERLTAEVLKRLSAVWPHRGEVGKGEDGVLTARLDFIEAAHAGVVLWWLRQKTNAVSAEHDGGCRVTAQWREIA